MVASIQQVTWRQSILSLRSQICRQLRKRFHVLRKRRRPLKNVNQCWKQSRLLTNGCNQVSRCHNQQLIANSCTNCTCSPQSHSCTYLTLMQQSWLIKICVQSCRHLSHLLKQSSLMQRLKQNLLNFPMKMRWNFSNQSV